jgi:hypothetical protein
MNLFGSAQVVVGVAIIVLGILAVWALRGEPGKPIPVLGIALLPVSILGLFVIGGALILHGAGVL